MDRWGWASGKLGGTFSVDEDIEDFVLKLIEEGYDTEDSCAGHIGYGYVLFNGHLDKDDMAKIKIIGRQFGLKAMRFKYESRGKYPTTLLEFKPHLSGGRRDFWGEENPEDLFL